MTIEQKIRAIEAGQGSIPGTSISRCLMDNRLLKKMGCTPGKLAGAQDTMVWCVSVGQLMAPKEFFYGYTVGEAVERAYVAVTSRKRKRARR